MRTPPGSFGKVLFDGRGRKTLFLVFVEVVDPWVEVAFRVAREDESTRIYPARISNCRLVTVASDAPQVSDAHGADGALSCDFYVGEPELTGFPRHVRMKPKNERV